MPKRISLLLTIISLLLWVVSIVQAEFTIGNLGFIHSLPVTFWFSLVFLLAASLVLWLFSDGHTNLLGLQVCLLVIYLWATPLLLFDGYPYVTANHSYWRWGVTDYIIRHGNYDPQLSTLYYTQWPAVFIFSASANQLINVNPDVIILLTPMVMQFIMILPLSIFLNNILGSERRNCTSVGVWIFCLGNWLGIARLDMSGFGYLMFLIVLMMLTSAINWQHFTRSIASRFLMILAIISVTISHLLSAVMGVTALIMATMLNKFKDFSYMILAVLLVGAWTLYGSSIMFESKIGDFLNQAFRLDWAFTSGIVGPTTSYDTWHQLIARFRVLDALLVIVIGFLGFIVGKILKDKFKTDAVPLFILIGIILTSVLIGASYNRELFHRTFLFILPVVAYFAAKLREIKKGVIIFSILVIPLFPLFFISYYGNIATDAMSRAHIQGMHTFLEYAPGGNITGGNMLHTMKNREYFKGDHWHSLVWKNDELITNPAKYICLSKVDKEWYDYTKGTEDYITVLSDQQSIEQPDARIYIDSEQYLMTIQNRLESTTNANVIYINQDMMFYICERYTSY